VNLMASPRPSAHMRGHRALLVLLAAVIAWGVASVTFTQASPDERQNLTMAYNIATYNVASSIESDGKPPANMRREPLYPALLSVVLGPGDPNLNCLAQGGAGCAGRAFILRLVNVLLLAVACWLTYLLAVQFVPPRGAFTAAAAVGFSPALTLYNSRLLTEPLAAALLLAGTYSLVRFDQQRSVRWASTAGAAFGLLILVKTLFLVVVPALALLVAFRLRRPTAALALLAVALAVVAPWSLRNLVLFDTPAVASGASSVLAVRATSLDMTGKEYVTAFVYGTGVIGPRVSPYLFPRKDYIRHDRSEPMGFYQRSVYGQGGLSPRQALIDRPMKNAALTLPFAWSGAFGAYPSGGPAPSWAPAATAPLFKATAAAGVLLRWAAFLSLFFIAARCLRSTQHLLLIAPALLLFGGYAAISHFIPRYGQPLLPVAYICLVIAVTALVRPDRRPGQSGRTTAMA
jgi:4-amino-4-deoxy-L-arabinose transferase-like glycosyltransferase